MQVGSWGCVIWAHHALAQIGPAVRAARALPGMDTVVVCADASTEQAAATAVAAGAIVVSHERRRGRAAAFDSAVNALGLREQRDRRPPVQNLLFATATLGAEIARLLPLMELVPTEADLATAVPIGDREQSAAEQIARRGIAQLTGWAPAAPLTGLHAMTRRTFELASPLAPGWGADVGLLADVRTGALRMVEVQLELPPEQPEATFEALAEDARQLADVSRALAARGVQADAWVPDGPLRALWQRTPWGKGRQ